MPEMSRNRSQKTIWFSDSILMNPSHEHLFAAQKQMADAIARLDQLKSKIGMAKQIVEFSGDRRRSALSVLVVEYLRKDCGVSAAEHEARSDVRYKEEMKKIMSETASAETVIKEWEIEKTRFESARSILSVEKSLLQM